MAEMTIAPVASHGFFIDGRWLEDGDIVVEVRAPYDGNVIARVVQARREHAEGAIAAAVKAFGTTRRFPAFERQRVLRRVAQSISERRDEFSRTLAQEAGKPIKLARIEVDRAVFILSQRRRRGSHAHLRRVFAARLAGIDCRPLGHGQALSDRAHCGHHAVQLSVESHFPQSRSRDCRGMFDGAEASAPDAAVRAASG